MNYRDYIEIMESEGLKLPAVAEYTLEKAKWCQNVIRRLKTETDFDTKKEIKAMEEKKIGFILEAIEWARMAKEMPVAFQWADKELKKKLR